MFISRTFVLRFAVSPRAAGAALASNPLQTSDFAEQTT